MRKKTYAKTGNVALSQFVANNKLLEGVDLGSPAPTYGEPLKKKNNFGGEDVVIPQLQHDKEGNLIAQTLIKFDTSGGALMTFFRLSCTGWVDQVLTHTHTALSLSLSAAFTLSLSL